MNDNERINLISQLLVQLHRNNLKTVARLKALEAIVSAFVLTTELCAWEQRLDEQANRVLQDLLEHAENQDPFFGATLDDRGPGDMRGIS